MDEFLSEENFTKHVNKQNLSESPTEKWRDLTVDILYRINQAKEVTTRYGPGMILELETREGAKKSTWAPERLAKELRGGVYPRYVRSHGLTPCKQDSSKSYYKYDLY